MSSWLYGYTGPPCLRSWEYQRVVRLILASCHVSSCDGLMVSHEVGTIFVSKVVGFRNLIDRECLRLLTFFFFGY